MPFFQNTMVGAIFFFFTLPLVVALLLIFRPWGLIPYSLVLLVWSLLFPVIVRPLPKEAVDFWYYCLGAVGVLLFYFSSSDERTRLELQSRYADALADQTEYIRDRTVIEPHLNSTADFVLYVKERSGWLADRNTRRCSTLVMLDSNWRGELDEGDMSRLKAGLPALSGRGGLTETACQMLIAEAKIVGGLASTKTASEFTLNFAQLNATQIKTLTGIPDTAVRRDDWIGFVEGRLEAATISHLLTAYSDQLDARIKGAEHDYKSASGNPAQPDVLQSFLQKLRHNLWPYIVLAAFGLKIARVNYLDGASRASG